MTIKIDPSKTAEELAQEFAAWANKNLVWTNGSHGRLPGKHPRSIWDILRRRPVRYDLMYPPADQEFHIANKDFTAGILPVPEKLYICSDGSFRRYQRPGRKWRFAGNDCSKFEQYRIIEGIKQFVATTGLPYP